MSVEVEERLRQTMKAVLVSSGSLLGYLSSATSDKVVPNPPAAMHQSIDRNVRLYQALLDQLDVEIQLSQKKIHMMIEERAKAEARLEAESKAKAEAALKSKAKAKEKEKEKEIKEASQEPEVQNIADQFEDDDLMVDNVNENANDLFGDSGIDMGSFGYDMPDADKDAYDSGDIKEPGDDNGGTLDNFDIGGFDGMSGFDDLLGNNGGGNAQGTGDGGEDEMGGLFGDDFDFMIPTG